MYHVPILTYKIRGGCYSGIGTLTKRWHIGVIMDCSYSNESDDEHAKHMETLSS